MTRKEWLASQKALELFGNRFAMVSLPLMLSATMSMVWFQTSFALLAFIPIAAGLLILPACFFETAEPGVPDPWEPRERETLRATARRDHRTGCGL